MCRIQVDTGVDVKSLERQLVKHCSPTLAGIKAANLIRLSCRSTADLLTCLTLINQKLNPKGVRLIRLKQTADSVWLYLYRPQELMTVTRQALARQILLAYGYDLSSLTSLLSGLKCRLAHFRKSDDFPHEIGIFLGYPPADVLSFCQCRGRNCLLSGTWKVYHDVEAAQLIFARHKICTRHYWYLYNLGQPIEKLAVASLN